MSSPGEASRAGSGGAVLAIVGVAFFLSGMAGLIYQVLWARMLGLLFGSDAVATSVVLAVFMGGLALGSFLGGILADRTRRPLVAYGLAEVAIALFALASGSIIDAAQPALASAYQAWGTESRWRWEATRALVAAATLLPPTTLMGTTLPLIVRHLVGQGMTLGGTTARFYAVNTFGAVTGTVLAGIVLLPAIGLSATTWVAVVTNLAIGIVCVVAGLRARGCAVASPASPGETRATVDQGRGRGVLLAIALSGCLALALEVLWTRALAMSFSATVYSFSLMLVCFLLGLFIGSTIIGRRIDRLEDPLGLLARFELGLGASVAGVLLVLEVVPAWYGATFRAAAGLSGGSFAAFGVIAPLFVSACLLAVPTLFLGGTLPLAVLAYGRSQGSVGVAVGRVTAANTLGAIVGALAAGFVLIPTLGTELALAAVALAFVANGTWLKWLAGTGARSRDTLGAIAFVGVLSTVALLLPYRPVLNFNQQAGARRIEVLYHAEGHSQTIDLLRTLKTEASQPVTSLVIGGNVEADDSLTQRRHFVLKAHLPLMFLERPRDVLIVGLGMGMTLRSTLAHPGVEKVQVVELTREVRQAHAWLGELTGHALEDPRVNVRIDDGRTWLQYSDATWDMITADPIHPKVTGVGYLYTREYYQLVRKHLRPHGVVCQWMPLYQLSPRSLRSAMRSFVEVFPHATLWYVKNHALFVARADDARIDYALLARKLAMEPVAKDLATIGVRSAEDFLGLLLLGPDEVRAFVAEDPDAPPNTDDLPYLEYATPREIFARPRDNVAAFLPHARPVPDLIAGLPADVRERLIERAKARPAQLLAELEPPPPR